MRVKQLEDALNTNTKVFSDGIQMLEAQNAVYRRVLQDIFAKQPRHLHRVFEVPGDGSHFELDFNAYLKEYIEELVAAEEKAKAGAAAPALVISADEDSPIIFGGDAP